MNKLKHDTIDGVWTENNPNALEDCSAIEAECFNAGFKQATKQILNLECLKEEKDREQRGSSIDYNFDVEIRNQLRKKIKEEINKL